MKVSELLKNKIKDAVTISVEITPPMRGHSIETMFRLVDTILPYKPLWIDITSHAADIQWVPTEENQYEKKIHRKTPGTIAICGALEYKFGIPTVPHLLCHGFCREETEDALIDLSFLGIENVLAIRGDGSAKEKRPGKSYHAHATDLVGQIQAMNQGQFLETKATPTQFEIGVACYPEKHFEAPNLEWDIDHFVQKQTLGANYAITQMFFDNQKYFDFCQKVAGKIKIPIIPATKILSSAEHLGKISKYFHVDLPKTLVDKLEQAKTEEKALDVGVEWAYQQSLDLIQKGHRHLHFYVMKNTKPFCKLMERFG